MTKDMHAKVRANAIAEIGYNNNNNNNKVDLLSSTPENAHGIRKY